MSAPFAAGAAALFLQANPPASPAQVKAGLECAATANGVAAAPRGSPALLLFTAPDGGFSNASRVCGVSGAGAARAGAALPLPPALLLLLLAALAAVL